MWSLLDGGNAAEVLEKLSAAGGDAPSVLLTVRGLAELEGGDPAAAAETLRAVLSREPENPVAGLYLSLALFECGDDRAAGEALHRAVLHPHRGFLLRFVRTFWPLRFTSTLRQVNRDAEPESSANDPLRGEFERWLKDKEEFGEIAVEPPVNEAAPAELARIAREFTTPEGRLARRGRKLAERYLALGARAYREGNLGHSRAMLARAHEIRPRNERAATHLAYISLFTGDAGKAMAVLDPVVRDSLAAFDETREAGLLPSADGLVCYAWALHEEGRHEDAIGVLSLVHEEGPEDFGANFIAAVSWLMLGEEGPFEEAFNRSMQNFYIDTWEQLLRPFVLSVGTWLEQGGRTRD